LPAVFCGVSVYIPKQAGSYFIVAALVLWVAVFFILRRIFFKHKGKPKEIGKKQFVLVSLLNNLGYAFLFSSVFILTQETSHTGVLLFYAATSLILFLCVYPLLKRNKGKRWPHILLWFVSAVVMVGGWLIFSQILPKNTGGYVMTGVGGATIFYSLLSTIFAGVFVFCGRKDITEINFFGYTQNGILTIWAAVYFTRGGGKKGAFFPWFKD